MALLFDCNLQSSRTRFQTHPLRVDPESIWRISSSSKDTNNDAGARNPCKRVEQHLCDATATPPSKRQYLRWTLTDVPARSERRDGPHWGWGRWDGRRKIRLLRWAIEGTWPEARPLQDVLYTQLPWAAIDTFQLHPSDSSTHLSFGSNSVPGSGSTVPRLLSFSLFLLLLLLLLLQPSSKLRDDRHCGLYTR